MTDLISPAFASKPAPVHIRSFMYDQLLPLWCQQPKQVRRINQLFPLAVLCINLTVVPEIKTERIEISSKDSRTDIANVCLA